MLNLSWRTFSLSSCFLIYSLFTLSLSEAGTRKASDGSTLTFKTQGMKELTDSQTNLPLFFSEPEKFSLEVESYNNGEVIGDWYTKTNALGGREARFSVQRAVNSWFGVFTWQSAKQIEDFKELMRTRAKHIGTSTSNIVTHRFGGTDFGFSAIQGNCIFARWAFNLRGMSIYGNDEGDPDTVIQLDGCNIFDRDPSSVFKKIRLMDSDFRNQIANKQNNKIGNERKPSTQKLDETSKSNNKKSGKSDSTNVEAKLREAKDLFSKDLISREEYEKLKAQILGLD